MKAGRAIIVMILAAFPALGWAANERAKTDRSTKTHTLLVIDDTTGEIRALRVNASNELMVAAAISGGTITADQGAAAALTGGWPVRLVDGLGNELGLAATPLFIQSATLATAANQAIGNASLASIDGKDFATQATLAAVLAKLSADPSTGAKQDTSNTNTTAIELNTDTATGLGGGVDTCTSVASEIGTTSATRREIMVTNASNSSVIFVGPTGVTTANGWPLAESFAAVDGEGGTYTVDTTQALFCIVTSGSHDVRWSEVLD